jgi:hypothetical protein
VLMAVDDGTVLDDPEFAGADLLVARAELLPDAATHRVPGAAGTGATGSAPRSGAATGGGTVATTPDRDGAPSTDTGDDTDTEEGAA